jgi:hypothetical protein
MKHLKPPVEQEAKRLGISLKDDCGKIKTKQKLCDEIKEKDSPIRISSRKGFSYKNFIKKMFSCKNFIISSNSKIFFK